MKRASRLKPEVQQMIFAGFVDDKTAVQTTIDVGRIFYGKKPDEWIIDQKHQKYIPSWHESFHKTVLRHYRHYRELILLTTQREYPHMRGEVEIDFAFFGGHKVQKVAADPKRKYGGGRPRLRRKRRKKTFFERPVMAILQRGGPLILLPLESSGRVFVELLIRQIVEKGSVVYSDGDKRLAELKKLGYMHRVILHKDGMVNAKGWHIGGVENAFKRIKDRIRRNFRGVPRHTIDMHIKEREFRYNHKRNIEDAVRALLK